MRRAQIELGCSDQGHAERAERMAERSPLRDGCHLHIAERNADDCAQHQCDGNPLVVDNPVVEQRADDRQQHADFTRPDAAPRRRRRTQPLQRQDEENDSDDVRHFNHVRLWNHGFCVRLDLNIFSMRSVMMKPPTILLVCGDNRDRPKNEGQRGLALARQDDGADHRDGIESIGQRHQRRVQQG